MMLVERRIAKVSDARASDQFRRYKREPTHAVRKAEIKENETLRALKQAWQNFELVKDDMTVVDLRESYQKALELIRSFAYNKADIENFNLALGEFQNEKGFAKRAGLFLSALINNGSDSTYTIFTQHLENINSLGAFNTKTIIVEGDAGDNCGIEMAGGKIVINGDTDDWLGNGMGKGEIILNGDAGDFAGAGMLGGTIKINGSVCNYLGLKMKDGKIVVNGNSGDTIAAEMRSGEIHLNGTFIGIFYFGCGGKIYHKGSQIWPIKSV